MEFDWTAEDVAFREELAELVEAELAGRELLPGGGPGSAEHVEMSRRFAATLAERRWLTPSWPSAYGGGDASAWRHIIMSEELWKRGEPRGPQYMNVNWIGPSIIRYGSEEQKAYHLPRISAGDVLWCQGFSEPDAGSDLAALRTRAVRDGDRYIVDGQKIWTSYADAAEFCFLLVRTDPHAERHRGITILLTPMDLPGIEVREIPAFVGRHVFHELFLTDVAVPVSCRLGEENEGWPIIRDTLAYERVGAPKYARAAWVLDRLAEEVSAGGHPVPDHLKRQFGEARARCEAARLLAYVAIDERARDAAPSAVAYPARAAMVEADRAVADLAVAVLGAGTLDEGALGADQINTAFTAGVATGTLEMQLDLISRRILGLPR